MKGSKSRLLELPRWFSLDNYQAAKKFTQREWMEQVALRQSYALWHGNWGAIHFKVPPDEQLLRIRKAWIGFMKTPCNLDKGDRVLRRCWHEALGSGNDEPLDEEAAEARKYYEKPAVGVTWPTIRQFYELERRVPDETREQVKGLIQRSGTAATLSELKELRDLGKTKAGAFMLADHDLMHFLIVDFSLPKQLLEKQFANLLSELPVFGRHSENPSRKWAEMQLLPAMDILIWLEQEGMPCSERKLAETIFRGDEPRQNAFRHSTLSLARSLLKHDDQGERVMRALRFNWGLREQERSLQQSTAHKRRRVDKKLV